MPIQMELGSLILATLGIGGLVVGAVKLIIRDELRRLMPTLDERYVTRFKREETTCSKN